MTLDFSTFLGGTASDHIRDVATDSQGYIYVAGGTTSTDCPVASAYHSFHNPGSPESPSVSVVDVFVAKLDPTGQQVLWATSIGGPNADRAYGIEVDGQGNVYVAGRAGAGFPVTAGAFQTQFMGGQAAAFYGNQDGFVLKLSPDGSQLLWASYFGSSDPRIIRDLAVDASGNVYVASGYNAGGSWTPAVATAFQNSYRPTPLGAQDSVLAKIQADGSRVIWATYLGGSGNEWGEASVRVDSAGNPVLLTTTTSANVLTTPGAYDTSYNGAGDYYVAKLSTDGRQLLWGTYLGGSGLEHVETHELAMDGQGNVIIASGTTSADYPTTLGAFDRSYNGSGGPGTGGGGNYPGDVAVSKLSADGARLLASTFVGGRFGESGEGVAVDSQGNVYVSGGVYSDNFPTTADAFQRTLAGTVGNGNIEGFIFKLSPDLSQLVYSTYMGTPGGDLFRSLTADAAGNVLAAGAGAAGWPLRNAVQSTILGSDDAVLVRFLPGTTGNQAPTVATAAGAAPNPVLGTTTSLSVLGADDGGEANLRYTWAATAKPTGAANPTFSVNGTNAAKNTTATFSLAGAYTFQVTITDAAGLSASSAVTVTVNQTLTSITVGPASASVPTSGTQQFTATAKDQFGNALAAQPTFAWSVSGGGTISNGRFTAGPTPGGPFTVTARSGAVSGTASVTVSPAVGATLPYQENFDDGTADFFASQLGAWTVSSGRYQASPNPTNSAISTLQLAAPLPGDLTVQATVHATTTNGYHSNAFVIFDYRSPTDFKYAGLRVLAKRWVIGHRSGNAWVDDVSFSDPALATGTDYRLAVRLEGNRATLSVNGAAKGSFSFGAAVNIGSVGLGTENAISRFDDMSVQATASLPYQESFDDGTADGFAPQAAPWWVTGGRYQASPTMTGDAVSLLQLPGPLPSDLTFTATAHATAAPDFNSNAFVIFDYRSPTDFKYAGLRALAKRWVVGHRTASGWVDDVSFSDPALATGTDYRLAVRLEGNRATLSVNGVAKGSFSFAGLLNGGLIGLGTHRGVSFFDDVLVQ